MGWSRQQQATAESVTKLAASIASQPLPEAERARQLDTLASQVNRLNFQERRQLALSRGLDPVFEQMTDEERQSFLDRTLPQGFAQIIEVFNKMSPEERRAAVERALDDLRRAEAESTELDWSRARARLEDGSLQRVVEQGFQAYLQTASAETKLDLAPVIEQIQQNVRKLRND
jgi:lauroyl/myristoyl acyltransferase